MNALQESLDRAKNDKPKTKQTAIKKPAAKKSTKTPAKKKKATS